jgi:hypothetical protein
MDEPIMNALLNVVHDALLEVREVVREQTNARHGLFYDGVEPRA